MPPGVAACCNDLKGLCPLLSRGRGGASEGDTACLAGVAQSMLQAGHTCTSKSFLGFHAFLLSVAGDKLVVR